MPKEEKEPKPLVSSGFYRKIGDHMALFEQIEGKRYYDYFSEIIKTPPEVEYLGLKYVPMKICPWFLVDEPLDYGNFEDLWKEIYDFIHDHLFLPEEALYDILTAWTFCTWIQEVWTVVPYLFFQGMPNTGKTRGLEVLQSISYRGILASNMTSSAIFRTVNEWKCTIFLDETEIYNQEDKIEVIGLLNSGYRRGQYAIRVKDTDEGYVLDVFDVFGFKSLAGTKRFEKYKTLESRTIPILSMKAQRKISLRLEHERATVIRAKLLKWRFDTLSRETCEGCEAFQEMGIIDSLMEWKDGRMEELFSAILSVLVFQKRLTLKSILPEKESLTSLTKCEPFLDVSSQVSHFTDSRIERILGFVKELLEIRQYEEESTFQAEIIRILSETDIIDGKRNALTKKIAEEFNRDRIKEEKWKTQHIGYLLRDLGYTKRHTRTGEAWIIPEGRLKVHQKSYGIGGSPEKAHMTHIPHGIEKYTRTEEENTTTEEASSIEMKNGDTITLPILREGVTCGDCFLHNSGACDPPFKGMDIHMIFPTNTMARCCKAFLLKSEHENPMKGEE